ncbi:Adhesion G protein-coupled receptor L3 [Trichoplax sp. H2]|nr:Adhesion G protein-coupled receptor L3 [Trichoplax sp. H2]|eukprot:RDD40839.1 Adhesion G protein-coupled receptor L3 [Trichoplax sp. H2]
MIISKWLIFDIPGKIAMQDCGDYMPAFLYTGYIISPNYPYNYSSPLFCSWSVGSGQNGTAIVKVIDFNLRPRVEGVCSDSVSFSFGVEPDFRGLPYCGRTYPQNVYFQSRNIHIIFATQRGSPGNYTGFKMSYSLYVNQNNTVFTYQDPISTPIREISLNNQSIRITGRNKIHLTCGYKNLPVLNGTKFQWYLNNQTLGPVISPSQPTFNHSNFYRLQLSQYQNMVILQVFPSTEFKFDGHYGCSIFTPAQDISLGGNLLMISNYRVNIKGDYTVIAGNTLQLQCTVTYTSGIAGGSENFIWYRSQIPIVSGANSNVQIERQGSESILTLRNIQRQSSNTSLTHFTCSYDGVMGIKEAHHTIEIFPAQPQPSTCPKQQQNDFSWPETPVDAVAVIPCGQLSSGNVTRACLLDTAEQLPRWGSVSSINCVSQPFISIQQQASNLTDKNNNATEVLTRLQNITNTPSNQSLTGGDILVANSILEKVANISDELSIQIKDLYEFVRTGSNLIEKKNRDQWIEIQKTKPGTTELAQNLDRYGSLVGLSNETIIVAADNIVMEISALSTETEQPYQFPSEFTNRVDQPATNIVLQTNSSRRWLKGNQINLPPTVFQSYDVSTTIKIVSFIYKTLNELLPEQVDQTLKTNSSRWIPQTVVISTSLYPPLNKKLLEPIDYTLQKVSNSELLFNRELYKVTDEFNCSFWNYTIKTIHTGAWSRLGCRTKSSNASHIVCECDHLTNFAVLLRLSERNLTQPILLSLEIITYVGCGFSVVGLSSTLVIYSVLWKFLKNPTNKIHMNLFAWLLVANLIIMFVDLAKHIKVLCTILASVLHFSLLTTFMWMLVEGIHIYLVLIKVFDVNEKFLYYQLASIGVPALIAGLTAAIMCGAAGMEYYLSSQGCWLSATNWVILAFVIPFVIIFVTNIVFCGMAIYTMLNTQKVAQETGDLQKTKIALRGLSILAPILGLTWSFGCILMISDNVVIQYLFAITNSVQGLYIFLAYCAFSQKVKEAYGKYKKQGKRHFIMKEKPSNTKEKSNDSSYPSSKVGNVKTEKTSIITSTDVEKSVNVTSAEQMKQENINPESCEENFVVLSVPEVSVLPETNDSLADTDSRADSELDQKPLSGGDPIERKNEEEVLKKQSYSDQENLSLEDQQELLRIKIRGLHPQASTDEIREYFKRYGKIERIGSISKHQANQSDDENEDTVETYVVYHEKSAIDSIFSETKDTHIIHDRQVYLQL